MRGACCRRYRYARKRVWRSGRWVGSNMLEISAFMRLSARREAGIDLATGPEARATRLARRGSLLFPLVGSSRPWFALRPGAVPRWPGPSALLRFLSCSPFLVHQPRQADGCGHQEPRAWFGNDIRLCIDDNPRRQGNWICELVATCEKNIADGDKSLFLLAPQSLREAR